MSVSDYERHQVFQWFDDAMGSERARVMMNLLPPVGWGDIATRADLAGLRIELKGEIAELRGELRGSVAELRGEMADLRSGVRRSIYFGMLASNVTVAGLVLAALQLG